MTRHRHIVATVVVAAGTAVAIALGTFTTGGVASALGTLVSPCSTRTFDASTTTTKTIATAIGASSLWRLGYQGQGVDVAVIDSGVSAVPGLTSLGKISDAVDLSFDGPNPNLRYRDLFGHGTAMANIIAGDGSSGEASTGIAPKARIVNVKVGAGDGSADVTQVIAALDWVVANKTANGRNIRIVNLSYSTDAATDYRTDPLAKAVENAWNAGIVVVASAGNDGLGAARLGNPALDPFAIAVGGSTWDSVAKTYAVAPWSSVGDGMRNPDFIAPGTSIPTARVPGSFLDNYFPGARIADPSNCKVLLRGSGTSQAAAVTSGAVALLLQKRPTLTPDQVKDLLVTTTLPAVGPATQYGAGLLQIGAAAGIAPRSVAQSHTASTGEGSIEAARGSVHVSEGTRKLTGENDAFRGAWDGRRWSGDAAAARTWDNERTDAESRQTEGTWMGHDLTDHAAPAATAGVTTDWTGSSWTGSSWSGSSWTGSSWTGSSWTGSSWTGSSWTGSSWTGSSWSGSSWTGYGWL